MNSRLLFDSNASTYLLHYQIQGKKVDRTEAPGRLGPGCKTDSKIRWRGDNTVTRSSQLSILIRASDLVSILRSSYTLQRL